jgi:hypothetical protein
MRISPTYGCDTDQASIGRGSGLAESRAMLEEYTRATFDPHVGTSFRLLREGAPGVELMLVEVGDIGRERDGRSFSLLFRAPAASGLGQGTVELEHERLGSVVIFLVPVGADADGVRYEAVFNRLPSPG